MVSEVSTDGTTALRRLWAGLVDLLESGLTCFGAALARLGANAAVLVFSCVLLALVPAFLASLRANLDYSAEDFDIGTRASRCHGARRFANVGTVEIEPDTLPQLVGYRLGEACIPAGGSGLGTAVALFYAPQQLVGRASLYVRMGADHFSNLHGSLLTGGGVLPTFSRSHCSTTF